VSVSAAEPDSAHVAPALRASYAVTYSRTTSSEHSELTGAHIILTDGTVEPSPERLADKALETGLFRAT
jgi:hypothetical protein